QVPPSHRSTVPSVPTAQTSSLAAPHTPLRCSLVGLGCCRHDAPSQCRVTPVSPTAQMSSDAKPQRALRLFPCGSGFSQHQPSAVQAPSHGPSGAVRVTHAPLMQTCAVFATQSFGPQAVPSCATCVTQPVLGMHCPTLHAS